MKGDIPETYKLVVYTIKKCYKFGNFYPTKKKSLGTNLHEKETLH